MNENTDWRLGYSAGHYCNATQKPWSENFNMYSYVTEELPSLIESSFEVNNDMKSIMGHSMGGNGALISALHNPSVY